MADRIEKDTSAPFKLILQNNSKFEIPTLACLFLSVTFQANI